MQCEARSRYTSTSISLHGPAQCQVVQSYHRHTNQSDVTQREDYPDLRSDFLFGDSKEPDTILRLQYRNCRQSATR